VLSAVLPGLGQFYNGQPKKGALHLGLTLVFFVVAGEYQDMPEEVGVAGLVGTWVWSVIDAPLTAKAINEGRVQLSVAPGGGNPSVLGLAPTHHLPRIEMKISVKVPDF